MCVSRAGVATMRTKKDDGGLELLRQGEYSCHGLLRLAIPGTVIWSHRELYDGHLHAKLSYKQAVAHHLDCKALAWTLINAAPLSLARA